MTGGDGSQLSNAFRDHLLDYDLSPNEYRLAQLLCLETFDQGRPAGRIALERWADRLALRDAKGPRPDKCAAILNNLKALGVVDVNAAQGTFEPRPDAVVWSRARAYRARANPEPPAQTPELELRDVRELPEMISALNRQAALGGEQPGDNVAGKSRRSSPKAADVSPAKAAGTEVPDFQANAGDTNGTVRTLSVQRSETLTFNRLNVSTNKRLTLGTPGPGAGCCEQVEQVRGDVRDFVGAVDFGHRWDTPKVEGYLWRDPERVEALAATLRYVLAGIASGEIIVRTSRGAYLWSAAQIHWRQRSKERAQNLLGP